MRGGRLLDGVLSRTFCCKRVLLASELNSEPQFMTWGLTSWEEGTFRWGRTFMGNDVFDHFLRSNED